MNKKTVTNRVTISLPTSIITLNISIVVAHQGPLEWIQKSNYMLSIRNGFKYNDTG